MEYVYLIEQSVHYTIKSGESTAIAKNRKTGEIKQK